MDFNIGLSGLNATNVELGVVSNNIANSNTTGFKSSRTEFGDIYHLSALQDTDPRIGGGVMVNRVAQNFSQGQIEFTNGGFDLAINGNGFFVLSDNGSKVYSRAGNMGVDKNGYIVNVLKHKLQGYLSDGVGHITGQQGDLQIKQLEDAPEATTKINISVNLDATATPPSSVFVRGFDPNTPPDPSTYNTSTATTIYDSLGSTHVLTTYFVKSPQENTWETYIGIDGVDVTPAPATPPVGPFPAPYPAGKLASPYTLVFNQNGVFIPNNSLQPAEFYGAGPVTNTTVGLIDSGTLPKVNPNDLMINDVAISPPLNAFDPWSTSDNAASALSLATAINQKTGLHGVTATINSNKADLGVYTPGTGVFAAGNLTINGVQIVGTAKAEADLLGLINAKTSVTGVTATGGGSVTLTTTDGRNVQLVTSGGMTTTTFANFDLTGAALDKTQAGTINLATNNNDAIIIAGKNPGDAGLTAGPQMGIVQTSSDPMVIADWTPAGGAAGPQVLNIDFAPSSQYGAPFSVFALRQDGYGTGVLSGIDISGEGIIFANYSNGRSLALGQVELAFFNNVRGLHPNGNTGWLETFDSGVPLIGAPGSAQLGLVQWRALERSNVDLTDQLVGLIIAQRDFQANAQSIKTADAMTQTIINLR